MGYEWIDPRDRVMEWETVGGAAPGWTPPVLGPTMTEELGSHDLDLELLINTQELQRLVGIPYGPYTQDDDDKGDEDDPEEAWKLPELKPNEPVRTRPVVGSRGVLADRDVDPVADADMRDPALRVLWEASEY